MVPHWNRRARVAYRARYDSATEDPIHHFCIEVDDLDCYRSVLTKAGFEIKEAPALPFRPRFYTWDPFRNLIEIVHVEGDYVSGGEAAED